MMKDDKTSADDFGLLLVLQLSRASWQVEGPGGTVPRESCAGERERERVRE